MCFSLKSSARWALALLALLSLPACSQKREPREKPLVVTSFFPLYDFARQLGGTNFDVRCLVPPGADPHSVEASAGSAKLIADSDLVLLLGLGIDGWVERLAKAEGRRQMATISGGIPTRKPTPVALEEFGKTAGAGPKHDHDHDHDHAHPAEDSLKILTCPLFPLLIRYTNSLRDNIFFDKPKICGYSTCFVF